MAPFIREWFVGVVLILPLSGLAEEGALAVGDSVHHRFQYSNVWNERNLPREKFKLNSRILEDPFTLEFEFESTITGPGAIQFRIRMLGVRYNRGRGEDRWGFDARKKNRNVAEVFRQRAEDLALAWRHQFMTRLEREVLEQQMLATALLSIDDSIVHVLRDPDSLELQFPGLDPVLAEKLPASFPEALRKKVPEFLSGALAHSLFEPMLCAKGDRFRKLDRPYRITRVSKSKRYNRAIIEAESAPDEATVSFEDSAIVDCRTGVAIEGSSTWIPRAIDGKASRLGIVRWTVKLRQFKKVSKKVRKKVRKD